MKAYYTPTNGFIYVVINNKEAKDIQIIEENCIPGFNKAKEIHLTTDGAWDLYYTKRLREPSAVKLYKTQEELNKDLEIIGFFI